MSAQFAPPTQAPSRAVQTKSPLDAIMAKLAKDNEATKQEIALVLPKGSDVDRILSEARLYIMASPNRDKLLACTPVSILTGIKKAASCGLALDGRNCHLVPYGNVCQFQLDYKGLIVLVKRNKTIALVFSELVYENDTFRVWVDEGGKHLMHEPNYRGDRGELLGVYTFSKDTNGEIDWEYMTIDQVDAVRQRSRAKDSGPWVTDTHEMVRKTPLRRISKRWDLDPVALRALEDDDDAIDVETTGVTTDAPPQSQMFAPAPPPKALPKPAVVRETKAAPQPDPEPEPQPEPEKAPEPAQTPKQASPEAKGAPLVLEPQPVGGPVKPKAAAGKAQVDYLKSLKAKAEASGVDEHEIVAYMRSIGILKDDTARSLDEVHVINGSAIRAVCIGWDGALEVIRPEGAAEGAAEGVVNPEP